MTAYEKLKNIDKTISIDEHEFYQLIQEFQISFLNDKQYEERLKLHRNPIEVKNELYTELCSYSLKIQSREEMRDIDEKCVSYVPTKVNEIWMADKRLKSIYHAIVEYCTRKSKNLTVIALHMAEYEAVIELIGKIQKSINDDRLADKAKNSDKENLTKKNRTRIPNQAKIKAELQREINSVCPFCENMDVGHFEIHHIDNVPSHNEPNNLILLCPTCHSKITKGDISQAEVIKKKNELINKKTASEKNNGRPINFNSSVNNAIFGSNNVINISQTTKSAKQKYPPGCIGFDTVKSNYVGYLINRYHEYKEYELGKGNIKYAIFPSHLKKQFKIGSTRSIYNLPIEKFDELVCYIQSRIENTKLAKVKGKGHKNYSTFLEYGEMTNNKMQGSS
jgi:hypothetical protein